MGPTALARSYGIRILEESTLRRCLYPTVLPTIICATLAVSKVQGAVPSDVL